MDRKLITHKLGCVLDAVLSIYVLSQIEWGSTVTHICYVYLSTGHEPQDMGNSRVFVTNIVYEKLWHHFSYLAAGGVGLPARHPATILVYKKQRNFLYLLHSDDDVKELTSKYTALPVSFVPCPALPWTHIRIPYIEPYFLNDSPSPPAYWAVITLQPAAAQTHGRGP